MQENKKELRELRQYRIDKSRDKFDRVRQNVLYLTQLDESVRDEKRERIESARSRRSQKSLYRSYEQSHHTATAKKPPQEDIDKLLRKSQDKQQKASHLKLQALTRKSLQARSFITPKHRHDTLQ